MLPATDVMSALKQDSLEFGPPRLVEGRLRTIHWAVHRRIYRICSRLLSGFEILSQAMKMTEKGFSTSPKPNKVLDTESSGISSCMDIAQYGYSRG